MHFESGKLLADLPVDLPRNYRSWLADPEPSEDLKNVRHAVERSAPLGVVNVKKE